MRMRVAEIVLDRTEGLARAAAEFGRGVLESLGQVDPCEMRLSGYRIEDRLTASVDQVGNLQPRLARLYIHIKMDLGEDRLMHLCQHGREYLEERCSRLGVLTARDAKHRFALGGRCAF